MSYDIEVAESGCSCGRSSGRRRGGYTYPFEQSRTANIDVNIHSLRVLTTVITNFLYTFCSVIFGTSNDHSVRRRTNRSVPGREHSTRRDVRKRLQNARSAVTGTLERHGAKSNRKLVRYRRLLGTATVPTDTSDTPIVTTETIHTLIAQQSCDQVCIDFQWLLHRTVCSTRSPCAPNRSRRVIECAVTFSGH